MPTYHKANQIDPSCSIFDRYRNYGDVRPSEKFLQSSAATLMGSNKDCQLLLAANMYLDLAAIQVQAADKHIKLARTILEDIIAEGEFQIGKYESMDRSLAPVATAAALKQSELPKWLDAATGSTVQGNYEQSLEAASKAASFVSNVDTAEATLIEFMPLLLGERARHRGNSGFQLGRMALPREEGRSYDAKDQNANWDIGFAENFSADSYLMPATRLSVKKTRNKDAMKYQRAGVYMLNARVCGFDRPFIIIDSCLHEMDGGSMGADMIFTTGQLDGITETIETKIEEATSRH